MKRLKRFAVPAAVLAVILLCLFLASRIWSIQIDEFKHKVICVRKMTDTYSGDSEARNAFDFINKAIADTAAEQALEHCEVLLSGQPSENDIQKYGSVLNAKYDFLRNPLYLILYDSGNVYYVFEESEYIFVHSDSDKPNVNLINSSDKYFKYKLDNDMYLFVKAQYYD